MPPPDPSPLSPEERALARRLAELDDGAEPSAALDARVLAAARGVQRVSMRRRRWPAAVGLAASLLLVVGVAWELRPIVQGRSDTQAAHRATRTVVAAQTAPARAKHAAPTPDISLQAPPPAPPARVSAAKMNVPSEPAVIVDTPAPAPPAPPPPPAEPVRESVLAMPAPAAAPASSAPAPAIDMQDAAREADRADAAGSARGDEPEDEVPPATADSPAVRDAWLQRIQGLVDKGDIASARTSLHAFVQRYPDYALPEDLRALAR